MGKFRIIITATIAGIILLLYGCFPSKKVVRVDPVHITKAKLIETPTKVFMKDSSMVLLQDGFTIFEEILEGQGQRYWMNREYTDGFQRLTLDSIATMSYYEKVQSGATIFGSAVMAITGAILTPFSVHCITCPKCCFGSCPTVYTTNGSDYGLEAELFSYSLSKFFQETDVDRLMQKAEPDGTYLLRLTNEALETHYINQFNLLAVRHPEGSDVYPTPDGRIISVRNLKAPEMAINSTGEDVRYIIENRDDHWHYGDSTLIERAQHVFDRDYLDLTLNIPEGADKVKLVIKARNTLLSTVLFYDVVLASQGVNALEWTQRLNTDKLYATMYHMAYNNFAGVEISVNRDGDWEKTDRFGDVGPIAWKEQAVVIPVVVDDQNRMKVRLEWFPDNFMIDYIGYDVTYENDYSPISIDEIVPLSITNFMGADETGIFSKIKEDDFEFLITNPGDYFDLEYHIPPRNDVSTTLFIKSKGYYTEWLRGDWIALRDDGYQFNLFEVDKTLEQLKMSWRENRFLLEQTFFETRIPLKGE